MSKTQETKNLVGQNPITLAVPITRGETKITEITLRKPMAGELRGLHITELMQMEVGELLKLTPRISQPTLTEEEVSRLQLEDVLAIGGQVVGFFMPNAVIQTV